MLTSDRISQKNKKAINYYSILGLAQTASGVEVKNAYEDLILRQRTGPSEDQKSDLTNPRLLLIKEAYATLSNSESRQKYDEHLQAALHNQESLKKVNFFSHFYFRFKIFGSFVRIGLIILSLFLLVSFISFLTYTEIINPETRIKGIQDGLLLYSLMSACLLIVSYFKDIPSRVRAWFRVISICILAFSFTVSLGLFGVPKMASLFTF